jgi:Tfp pilus assembly protein PilX
MCERDGEHTRLDIRHDHNITSARFLADGDFVAVRPDVSACKRPSAGDLLADGPRSRGAVANDPVENAVKVTTHDESGAALVLALAFVIMMSLIAGGLIASVTSSLNSGVSLDKARAREYAADSAVQYAITQVRALPDPGPALTGCADGTHYSYTSADNPAVNVRVNCSNVFQFTRSGFQQRNVIFNACVEVGSDCTDANSVIRAQVNFQTVGTGASMQVTRTWVQSWSVNA